MDFTNAIFSLASIGPFASRIFLPAFVSALLLRFGNHIPRIEHMGVLALLHHDGAPTWFTANPTLLVLFILATAEVFSQKSSDARLILHEFDIYLKPALAALTAMGFAKSTDAAFVRQLTHQAGIGQAIVPLLTAFGTYHLANVRKKVMSAVINHFEGTRLATWISWAEDFWVIFAVVFMFLFAVLGLILIAGSIALLLIVRKRWQIAEERRKIACLKCGKMVYPCAVACGSCGQSIGTPMAIGFLGQSKLYLTDDVTHHPYRLMEKRRCPICAAHLPVGRPFEPCRHCAKVATADPEFVQGYSNYIGRRLAPVLLLCAAIGAVPFVGMIVGTVYYELVLVVPYSQYLPMGRRFLLRWELRILFFILAMLQVIPVVGIVSVPLAAWISYAAYQRSYQDAMFANKAARSGPVETIPA